MSEEEELAASKAPRTISRGESRRWNVPRSRARRRRAREMNDGGRVLELLARLRDGAVPPESPDAFP
jgi:hypothetical protein